MSNLTDGFGKPIKPMKMFFADTGVSDKEILMITNLDRLNKLYKCGFHLHVFNDRYGRGIVTILTQEQDYDQIETIICEFDGGDDENNDAVEYFSDNDWYPIAFAATFFESLDNLLTRINAISEETLLQWQTEVAKAGKNFKQNVQAQKPTGYLPKCFPFGVN